MLAGLEGFLKIVNRDLIEFEVFFKTLDGWRGCRRWIDSASRAQRRVSSRGQSRSHPSTKEAAARVVFRRGGSGPYPRARLIILNRVHVPRPNISVGR